MKTYKKIDGKIIKNDVATMQDVYAELVALCEVMPLSVNGEKTSYAMTDEVYYADGSLATHIGGDIIDTDNLVDRTEFADLPEFDGK